MIDLRAPVFSSAYPKTILPDPPSPQYNTSLVADHVANLNGDDVVTSRVPPAGVDLATVFLQQSLYPRHLGIELELHQLEALDTAARAFPPARILHGDADSAVPIEGSHKLAEQLRNSSAAKTLQKSWIAEGEHGFDLRDKREGKPATFDTAWVEERVEFVERY